jgi:hypothetical protein
MAALIVKQGSPKVLVGGLEMKNIYSGLLKKENKTRDVPVVHKTSFLGILLINSVL